MLTPVPADHWFATCPRGIESLLADELRALGADRVGETVAGVSFTGPRALAYRACLWSRLANRVLWPLADVAAPDADVLYKGLKDIAWGDLFDVRATIAVDFSGSSGAIRNTRFGAQRCKDAVVDWFVANGGSRPSVDRQQAQVRINVRLERGQARVSLDLSGSSLHRRGYRAQSGAAPLKENLAAALLLRADWPGMAARGGALIDPMCGSGTLLIEGAMMAADIAPGILRKRFGFEALAMHDSAQWQALVADARGRAERGRGRQLPEMRGYDRSPGMVQRAQENIARLDLSRHVRVAAKPVAALKRPTHMPLPDGLLICNPPYGERLGEGEDLAQLYGELGRAMAQEFSGWRAAIFTPDKGLARATGLRSHKQYRFFNGAIETQLVLFDLKDNELRNPGKVPTAATAGDMTPSTEGVQMLVNRLRKNRRRLASWLKREQVSCYRLYDADMPEYAVAIDIYGEYVHVAEYRAPASVSAEAARRRMEEVRLAVPQALDVTPDRVTYKERARQRGADQYRKQAAGGYFIEVHEGQAKLRVNLRDYLDTGLFLDHRPLRRRIASEARGKDFLNLFCYTGTATVHAGLGGAASTTSVDTSNTYLDWLGENLKLNGLAGGAHTRVRADCMAWLADGAGEYDLMLVDPPSFSNSKSRDDNFDVQRDHVALLQAVMSRLRPDGVVYFSNNLRSFKLDPTLAARFGCEEITDRTLDPDFQRNRRIHRCWRLTHSPQVGQEA